MRILKWLNLFEVIDTEGNKSYFSVPFEGWYEDHDYSKKSKHFIWKLRDELVQALEKLGIGDEELTSYTVENIPDGKRILCYSPRYERNPINKEKAIKVHGVVCQGCGFDFEKTYGEIGKGYIEVHHVKSLFMETGAFDIDPAMDLICVCANCHRIIHRKRNSVLSLKELKEIVLENNK